MKIQYAFLCILLNKEKKRAIINNTMSLPEKISENRFLLLTYFIKVGLGM